MEKRIDRATIFAFLAVLALCVAAGVALVLPLLVGFALFFVRGLSKGVSPKRLAKASADGVWASRWVIVVLLVIGMMTALWRSSGTVALLVTALEPLFVPICLPLMSFVLCAVVSMLMGTAFGTAATAGCACMVICDSCGGNAVMVAGAVLAGSYFGDRCSPVSSSALLVAQLTGTDNLKNIAPMLKSVVVPTVISLVVYALLGVAWPGAEGVAVISYDIYFDLSVWVALPALSVVVLALAKVPTVANIAVSTLLALALTVVAQGASIQEALQWAVLGYEAPSQIASMAGGGLVSMVSAVLVIAVASTYSGLMSEIRLLEGVDCVIDGACSKMGAFATTAVVSLVTSMLACNQTLGILLTHQTMKSHYAKKEATMLDLEDSVVLMAPLVPWSIAGLVPLAILSSGVQSIPFAVFLYAVPLWRLVQARFSKDQASIE